MRRTPTADSRLIRISTDPPHPERPPTDAQPTLDFWALLGPPPMPLMAQRDAVGGHHNESRVMKPFVILPALAVGALMLFSVDTDAGPTCPPDGDDSDWPTFEVVEKCGSYEYTA
jgi:hypothetical protein